MIRIAGMTLIIYMNIPWNPLTLLIPAFVGRQA